MINCYPRDFTLKLKILLILNSIEKFCKCKCNFYAHCYTSIAKYEPFSTPSKVHKLKVPIQLIVSNIGLTTAIPLLNIWSECFSLLCTDRT